MKVLIIKLTSMGDLMHALPALTDAVKAKKEISFDWVVDSNFSEVPQWHPSVNKVIKTNHREWKKQLLSKDSRKALQDSINLINDTDYDLVVDMQNNLKSALISYLCNKEVYGMDRLSVREFPAHLAYSKKFHIPKNQHAIKRQRSLLAECLSYKITNDEIDYGIEISSFEKPKIVLPEKYIVLVHNASRKNKLWPVKYWQELIRKINNSGLSVLLLSGNKSELDRANEIVTSSDKAIALEPMTLNEVAFIINGAKGSVCCDTGLAHLSALIGIPSVTMYAVTDEKLIGTRGKNQTQLISTNKKMENIHPTRVWSKLAKLIFGP